MTDTELGLIIWGVFSIVVAFFVGMWVGYAAGRARVIHAFNQLETRRVRY